MPPDRVPLGDIADAATFQVIGRKLGTEADGTVTAEFVRDDGAVVGTLTVAADGKLGGQLTDAPMVEPLAAEVAVGDVLRNQDNGEVVVAVVTGLGSDGRQFSNTANRRRTFQPERWAKLAAIDPDVL